MSDQLLWTFIIGAAGIASGKLHIARARQAQTRTGEWAARATAAICFTGAAAFAGVGIYLYAAR